MTLLNLADGSLHKLKSKYPFIFSASSSVTDSSQSAFISESILENLPPVVSSLQYSSSPKNPVFLFSPLFSDANFSAVFSPTPFISEKGA